MTANITTLSPNAIECMEQLFISGPTWDGNVSTKDGRGELFERGLADRHEGWTQLTMAGLTLAVSLGMERKKERWQRERSRAVDEFRRWSGVHAEQGAPGDAEIIGAMVRAADTAVMLLREGHAGSAAGLDEHVKRTTAVLRRRAAAIR